MRPVEYWFSCVQESSLLYLLFVHGHDVFIGQSEFSMTLFLDDSFFGSPGGAALGAAHNLCRSGNVSLEQGSVRHATDAERICTEDFDNKCMRNNNIRKKYKIIRVHFVRTTYEVPKLKKNKLNA